MTPLRMRMIEDMRTAGLASGTQAIYLDGVRRLAAYYGRSPDRLSEEEVRAYLIGLRERGVALGTFKTNYGGIQFLYRQTLDRDWPLFGKKRSARQSSGVCQSLCPTARSGPSWAASATPCTGRAFP
jgi:Phage integrase, N-terminal SAM-like domain